MLSLQDQGLTGKGVCVGCMCVCVCVLCCLISCANTRKSFKAFELPHPVPQCTPSSSFYKLLPSSWSGQFENENIKSLRYTFLQKWNRTSPVMSPYTSIVFCCFGGIQIICQIKCHCGFQTHVAEKYYFAKTFWVSKSNWPATFFCTRTFFSSIFFGLMSVFHTTDSIIWDILYK